MGGEARHSGEPKEGVLRVRFHIFLLIKKLWMSKEKKKKNEVERLSRGWIAQGCGNHFESNTKPSAMLRAVPSKMVV